MNTEHLAAFGQAMAKGDVAAAFTHVSERIELFSPIFDDPFVGKEAVAKVMGAVKSTVSSSERTGSVLGEDRVIQFGSVIIDGVTGNSTEVLELDSDGLIARITVFWRPLRLAVAGHARLASLLGRDPVI